MRTLKNKLECMLATLLHEEPDVIPQSMEFMDSDARLKFLKNVNLSKNEYKRAVKYAELLDNFSISCGGGGFRSKTVKTGLHHYVVEWETGARWLMMSRPFSHFERKYVHYPVIDDEDLNALCLPDPDDPERYEGIKERVRYFTEHGYFTSCSINGFFSGVWYFLRPFKLWLRDLVMNKPFAKKIMDKLGEFNLKAAKNCLERGVHCIGWVDDLGYNKGMFISPETYKEIIYPWHKRVIRLAHKYGAFVNMHSHGNINAIIPLLVEAGLDAINPVGPSDNMDLKSLKEKFGDWITLQGGISKFIGKMNKKQLEEHLKDRISKGSPGGGYILSSEGGIPVTMTRKNFEFFMECSRKYRRNSPFLCR